MRRNWLRPLFRSWNLESSRRTNRRLTIESLEDRVVPATVSFQQDTDGYIGTTQVRLDNTAPNANVNGATVTNGVYFLDGLDVANPGGSPAQWDLIRFDSIFGAGPNQIPAGSLIRSASLRFVTGSTAESANSNTAGPFSVSQLNVPFDATSTWNSMATSVWNPEGTRVGPVFGVMADNPVAGFGPSLTTGTVALTFNQAAFADVTTILHNWSANPANNFGFNIRATGTTDGWMYRTIGHANITDRPQLTVTYDPPPVGLQVATFQQGVNGYSDSKSMWLQQNNTNTDGATMADPQFLDGRNTAGGSSPDDQLMVTFNNIIGTGPGQIPLGSTIESAYLELQSGGPGSSTAAQSAGTWAASQNLLNWSFANTYTSSFWTGNGPTHTKSLSTTPPAIGDTTTELKVVSTARGFGQDAKAQFDVKLAVQSWLADPSKNYGLNIQDAGTEDGWMIHFTGSNTITARPKLVVRFTPPAAAANNVADVANGTLTLTGGAGLNNSVNLSVASGIYTITDTSIINLTQAAKDAGWNGSGTTTITGPSANIAINTASGDDTITVAGASNRVTIDAGGQANDIVALTGTITTAGQNVGIFNAGAITATPGSLINVGTGTVGLSATAVGTSANPVRTQAGTLVLSGGNGGVFVAENDGANLTADVIGIGELKVTNAFGPLTVNLDDEVRTTGGAITLSSNDEVIINGVVGVSGPGASAGLTTIAANADGDGIQGFTQGKRSYLAGLGNFSVIVNTAAGGAGDALLGQTSIGGTLSVASNDGSILLTPDLNVAAETVPIITPSLTATGFDFAAAGAGSSIGTVSRPIPLWSAGGTDVLGTVKASFQSGAGGIFILDRSTIDLTITKAIATDSGDVSITTGDAGGHNLHIDGPVSTGSGAIILRANDDMFLTKNAAIGDVNFTGTVSLIANVDAGNEQRLDMDAAATIVTLNTSANAVSLLVTASDDKADDAVIGGISLANITVGSGGTISVSTGTTGSFAGNITQAAGTFLDAGAGKVVIAARSVLQADNTTPAVGAGIGTATDPVRVKAATVVVNSTNSPVFVTGAGDTSFTATVLGRILPALTPVLVPTAELSLATTTGTLTIGSSAQTDGGAISIVAAAGKIVINAPLGDSDSGNITVDAGANSIAFNANFTVANAKTATFIAASPVGLGPTTSNDGTLVAVNGVQIGSGETLTGIGSVTGPVSVLANGNFTPAGGVTAAVATGNVSVAPGGILALNTNGTTPGTGHDQIKAAGTVTVTDGNLRLLVGGAISLNDTYVIVDNDAADPVVGQFVGGTTIRAFNNPLVTFTIDYAGGDGNDIVAKVTDISAAAALLDVQGNQVIYFSNVGIANSVAVSKGALNYTIVESAPGAAVSLTQAAKDAGWTGHGTPTVTGPHAGVAGLNFGLSEGLDTITALDAGTAAITITGTGTLTLNGAAKTASTFTLNEFSALLLNGTVTAGTGVSFTGLGSLIVSGAGSITATTGPISSTRSGDVSINGPTFSAPASTIELTGTPATTTTLSALTANSLALNLTGSNTVSVLGIVSTTAPMTIAATNITSTAAGRLDATLLTLNAVTIGAIGAPVFTKAATIVADAAGGVFLTESDGATITATASSTGEIALGNNAGTLLLAGTTKTGDGPIGITSNDGITLDPAAVLGGAGFSGKLTINANADGIGGDGFLHNVGAKISTTSIAGDAATINVNSAAGGTGHAVLGVTVIGGNGGGTLTVNSNNGSIRWNPGYGTVSGGTLSNPAGGSSLQDTSLRARYYSLTSTGGGIGTLDTPIQTANFASADGSLSNSTATLSAGNGGIFLSDWSTVDLTITSANAAGGDIQLFSANQDGHNLFVAGTVFTAAGNIWLAADDDLRIEGATIGGPTFAGTILLQANRDNGNEQRILMSGVGSVETTSVSDTAITFSVTATDNDPANTTIGGVQLGTVKTGSGGIVTVDAAATPAHQGAIRQIVGTRVDVGEGTIILSARNLSTGTNPAAGAGIYFDLDGSGANTGPVQVFARNVIINAINSPAMVAEGDAFFFLDSNGFNLTASQTGLGFIKATSANGPVNVPRSTNTDGDDIIITAIGTGGGSTISGTLADANTGNITIDAGANPINFTANFTAPASKTATFIAGPAVTLGPVTTISAAATVTAASGLNAGSGRTLAGVGTANAAVAIAAGGVLAPGLSPGTLTTGNVSLAGAYSVEINGTAPGSFDQTIVNGSVNITGASLGIVVNGNLAKGNSFLVISNDGADPVVGAFTGGPDFFALNDPRYVFSVSTTGGDGNDVVVTVSNVFGTLLNVTPAKVVQFSSDAGINDNLSVDIVGANYVITDTATPITLSAAAILAGWTGGGTSTVTGPIAGVTGLALATATGADVITKLVAGVPTTLSALNSVTFAGPASIAGNFDIIGPATLAIEGALSAAGAVSVSSVTSITATSAGKLSGTVLALTAVNNIGTLSSPLNTQAAILTLTAGDGGVFVTETDGANVAATATNAGPITISNIAGILRTTGPVNSFSGPISLSSADSLEIDSAVGGIGYTGTIALAANTNNAGNEGFTQTLLGSLITENLTVAAASISVGGSGDAILGVGAVGGVSGGTTTVTTNNGSILWNGGLTLPPGAPDAGTNSNVLTGRDFIFTAGGAASAIGSATVPLQINALGITDGKAGQNSLLVSAGSGGAYVWEWGGLDLTLAGATVTGAGNINVVTANAGGNNLFVTGAVSAATGSITLWANDDIGIGPGAVIGGPGFSGTVHVSGNRDRATAGQVLTMDAASSIVTANATAKAVRVDLFGDAGTPSVITLANISVGNGGTITIDDSPEGEAGRIAVHPGTKLDAGPAGIVFFNTAITAGSGDAIGTSTDRVNVVAGSVGFLSLNGSVWISENDGANFAGNNAGSIGKTNLESAGVLFVTGPLLGGSITLTSTTGVNVSGNLGSAATGAIAVNGPLTGGGSITLGTGNLTVSQTTDSTFAGAISGSKDIIKQGAGTLTFSGTSPATGGLTANAGILTVTGSFPALSGASVAGVGTLAGTGTVNTAISTAGTLSPGVGGAGTLNTGSLSFIANSVAAIDLLGVAVGQADRLAVTGAVNLNGAKLQLNAPSALALGSKFTIVDNDGGDSVNGTFQGIAEGGSVSGGGQTFTVTYAGGDGNDVVLTRADTTPIVTNFTVNSGAAQRSRITTITINFQNPVDAATLTGLGAITLTRTAATSVGVVGTVVQTGATGANGRILVAPATGLVSSVTLTFENADGSPETFGVEYGSLADGRWQLAVPVAGFTSALNDVTLRRLFGDFEGAPGSNGTVDGNDFATFGSAFGSSGASGFSPFDYDNNGTIDSGDLGAIGARFGFSV